MAGCLPPGPSAAAPCSPLPEGACDSHAHVIHDPISYPLVSERNYDPAPAPPAAYFALLDRLGLSRGVLVQPSIYGDDNRLCLATTAAAPDRLRAVVVLGADTSAAELDSFHDQGARGFRINLLYRGGIGLELLERLAASVAGLNWHLELLMDIRELPPLLPRLRQLPLELVFDHMGHFPANRGTDWPGFQAMLALAREGRAWIKLSAPYRLAAEGAPDDAARAIRETLIAEVPARLVWGSDWPHVDLYRVMPDSGRLLNGFLEACPDSGLRQRILCDNPSVLYGF